MCQLPDGLPYGVFLRMTFRTGSPGTYTFGVP
jgi:hypothetical protein